MCNKIRRIGIFIYREYCCHFGQPYKSQQVGLLSLDVRNGLPIDLLYGPPSQDVQSPAVYAHDIRQSLEQAYEYVRVSTRLAQKRQKLYMIEGSIHGRPFKVGDKV